MFLQHAPEEETAGGKQEMVPDVNYYRDQAVQCLQMGNYKEAALFLTTAIQCQTPPNADLHCLRAKVYIKLDMLYLAYQDAEKAVLCGQNCPEAFIVNGQIYMAAGCYEMALMFFRLVAEINPMLKVTQELQDLIKRASVLANRSRMMTKRIPWVGAGVGIILAVCILLVDQLITDKPFISHPAIMVLIVIVISLMGYGMARGYLYYSKLQIAKRLSPPLKHGREDDKKEKEAITEEADAAVNSDTAALKNRARYSKAQARQRFKKGKF